MRRFSSIMDLGRWRRSLLLSALLCYLGMMAIYSIISVDNREKLLHPVKALLGSLMSDGESQALPGGLEHLARYNLTPTFQYSRRTIRTEYFTGTRSTLTALDETKLFGDWQILNQEGSSLKDVALEPQLPPLTLRVPTSSEVDTSTISFGMATNVERLPDAIPQLEHWLPHTETSLHILVPPSNQIPTLHKQMSSLGIKATIKASSLEFAKAYFSLIKELYDARTSHTKWLVLVDDDTFVPSLPALLSHLFKAYDPSEELLIAAMSDNIDQIKIFGLIPFGGGGIFISVPLAAKLVEPKVWGACMEIPDNQGDQIVNECLKKYSAVRPTFDPGLNQIDISGGADAAAGYYESGRQMLTSHHWRSPERWHRVDLPTVSYVSEACGDEGILMRWIFDGNIVLSNGYSVVEYPNGIDVAELEKVEHTWVEDAWTSEHRIGPLREKMNRDDKRTLKMVDTKVLEGYGVRQTYLEREETERPAKRGDRVLELLWVI